MGNENVVYTYKGILFNLEKEGNSDTFRTWMNLENIVQIEVSQSQEAKYHLIPFM